MALPSEIQTSTITGTYLDSQGEPCTGTVTFTPPCRLTSVLENVILSGPITVTLDANGSFAVELPCTDQDQLNPTDFTYTVTERLNCSPMCPRVFSIVVPCSQDEWDIADLTPVDSSPGTIMVQGPPGPTGPPGPQGPVTAVEAGSNIEITGTGTTANPYVISADTGFTSVTACGAVGDGVTDDAPAIQECLDAARDAGGGWVVVPEGDYLLVSLPLRMYRNTRLTLMNGARFVRGGPYTMLLNGDADQNYPGWTGHGNIIIEGGVWDSRGTASGLTAPANCIGIGHAADVTIRDLEIRDISGYHAIEMNSTKRGIVQNCRFLGFVDHAGNRGFSEALQLDLAKGPDFFGAFGPHDNTVCEDVLVTGCYFGASGTSGTTAWPRGIGSHSATIRAWHRRVRIVGCTFEGLGSYAVSVYNWEDVAVSACNLMECGAGVRLRVVDTADPADTTDLDGNQTNASQDMRDFAIVGNTIRNGGAADDDITVIGEDTGTVFNVAITGNVIDALGSTGSENGIRVLNASRVTIVGNTINNVDNTAISTESMIQGIIADNVVYSPGAYGITVNSSSHSNVTGNSTRETGATGIYVDAGEWIQIRDNYVRAPSRASNGTYYGIRVGGGGGSIHLSGNKTRPFGSGNEGAYGLRIFTGTTNVQRYGNDWRGSTWTSGDGMLDESDAATLNTSATDLG